MCRYLIMRKGFYYLTRTREYGLGLHSLFSIPYCHSFGPRLLVVDSKNIAIKEEVNDILELSIEFNEVI